MLTSESHKLCWPLDCQNHLDFHTTDEEFINCKNSDWMHENCFHDYVKLVIIMMYYELTTLSTVGYGDIYPISSNE